LGGKFLSPDGTLAREIMPDFLHLSEKGYALWAEGMEPVLAEMLAR
jgi:beta-glucosidase